MQIHNPQDPAYTQNKTKRKDAANGDLLIPANIHAHDERKRDKRHHKVLEDTDGARSDRRLAFMRTVIRMRGCPEGVDLVPVRHYGRTHARERDSERDGVACDKRHGGANHPDESWPHNAGG